MNFGKVTSMGTFSARLLQVVLLVPVLTTIFLHETSHAEGSVARAERLFWFIPDGMRADPELFNVFEWAKQGKLPNIKKMMEQGSYGYSIPVFPSHTPVNFATLVTGAYPKTHGVADGPMHVEGRPLGEVSVGGFSSIAKTVPPLWVTMEDRGKEVALLSIPGSTPPELDDGITVRGRWGGWGADFHAVNFQSGTDPVEMQRQRAASKLFFFGPELTSHVEARPASGWGTTPATFSPPLEVEMEAWGTSIFAYVFDSSDNQAVDYDRVLFSLDKQGVFAGLGKGEWSAWNPIRLSWKGRTVDSHVRVKVIRLGTGKVAGSVSFRIRCLYNNLNKTMTKPYYVADELAEGVGPMVDFADNFPPQLIHYEEDKKTFLEEADMSFQWHREAAKFMMNSYTPEIFIHDIYTPNQMLTSRWWLGYVDPASERYDEVTEKQREGLWEEVHGMYQKLDDILGEYLKVAGDDTLVVLSSDHGAVPLNKWVNLNNLFAREGLLKYRVNPKTGVPEIDWEHSQVVYLKMDNIYIHPDGLSGNWRRARGPEYEALRDRVLGLLQSLETDAGQKPVEAVVKWEAVKAHWNLPEGRVGDLIVANRPGFGWNEQVSPDLEIFSVPLKSGYKQAILPGDNKGMWTPFVIMGPGVKKNHEITRPILQVDQYPTIMKLMGMDIPEFVEGNAIGIDVEH